MVYCILGKEIASFHRRGQLDVLLPEPEGRLERFIALLTNDFVRFMGMLLAVLKDFVSVSF